MNYLKFSLSAFLLLMFFNVFSESSNAVLIKVSNQNYSDETIIRLHEEATPLFDGMFDAVKLFSLNPNVPSVYTKTLIGSELAINSLPEYQKDTSIAIYMDIPETGIYQVEIKEFFPFSNEYTYGFSNIVTGEHFQMFGDTTIVFEVTEAISHELVFKFNVSHTPKINFSDESCYNLNDGEIQVQKAGNSDWSFKLKNENNETIQSEAVLTDTYVLNNLKPGEYLLEVEHLGIVESRNFQINPGVKLNADFSLLYDTLYISDFIAIDFVSDSINEELDYYWSFGNGDWSNEIYPSYQYSEEGNYHVQLTVSNAACNAKSNQMLTIIKNSNLTTGISENEDSELEYSYLGNGNFEVNLNNKGNISVFNMTGNQLLTKNINGGKERINLSHYAQGLYVLSFKSENGDHFRTKIKR